MAKKRKKIRYSILKKFLKDHPNGTYAQFKKKTGYAISDATFYIFRKELHKKNGVQAPVKPPKKSKRRALTSKRSYGIILDYLKTHPTASTSDVLAHTGKTISYPTLYRFKTEPGKYAKYVKRITKPTVVSAPATNVPRVKEPKAASVYSKYNPRSYSVVFSARPGEYKSSASMLKAFLETVDIGRKLELIQAVSGTSISIEVREAK